MDAETRPAKPSWPSTRYEALWQANAEPPDALAFLAALDDASPHDRLDVLRVDQRQRAVRGCSLPAETYLGGCPEIAADPGLKLDLVCGEVAEARGPALLDELTTRFPDLRESLARQHAIDSTVREVTASIVLTRTDRSAQQARALALDPSTATPLSDQGGVMSPGPGWLDPFPGDGRFAIRRQLGVGGMGCRPPRLRPPARRAGCAQDHALGRRRDALSLQARVPRPGRPGPSEPRHAAGVALPRRPVVLHHGADRWRRLSPPRPAGRHARRAPSPKGDGAIGLRTLGAA